jgi:hypothetical protein
VYRCDFNNSVDLVLEFLPTFIAYRRHALKVHDTEVKHTHTHTRTRAHTHTLHILEGIKYRNQNSAEYLTL